jgi:hypothetical protein
MIYVEAPNIIQSDKKSIFLAGGITGCGPWAAELTDKIKDLDIVIYNPRRENFPIDDPNAALAQITWEFEQLKKATAISFWFSSETIQPIVLYECGAWSKTSKPIVIGVDPKYQRKLDVVIQTELVRPGLKIASSIEELADQIYELFNDLQFI